MNATYLLTDYIETVLERGTYEILADGTYSGHVPDCPGCIAFGPSLSRCQGELRSVLEEWIWLGLKLGHPLPVIAGIDLNKVPEHESADAL